MKNKTLVLSVFGVFLRKPLWSQISPFEFLITAGEHIQYRISDFCEHQITFKFVNSTKVLWKLLKLPWVFSEGVERSSIYSKAKLNTSGKRKSNTSRDLINCLCQYTMKNLKAKTAWHVWTGSLTWYSSLFYWKWVWPTRKSANYSPYSVLKISPVPQRHWRFTKPKVLGGLRLYKKAVAFTGTGGSQVLGKASDI